LGNGILQPLRAAVKRPVFAASGLAPLPSPGRRE